MERNELIEKLKEKARIGRIEVLKMTYAAQSGHPGGSMSAADVLSAILYYKMRFNPIQPEWPDRDRFILSKGHCCPILYAYLSDLGYFPKTWLPQFRAINSPLQGHPCTKCTPGVEASTGSLGQGLSIANGIALAGKIDNKEYKTFVLLGDGEIQEGNVWEAAMSASHYNLKNLVGIIDYNGLQIDGFVKDVMNIEPIADKWKAFGWNVIEIDGHDYDQIIDALDQTDNQTKPTMIIAKTLKGKGVSFMENQVGYHGKALTKDEMKKAMEELRNPNWEE